MRSNVPAASLSRAAALSLAAILASVSCTDVSVNTVLVDRLEIDPPAATIGINGSVRLTARVLSETGQELTGRNVAWTSLNPSIAAVDGAGSVSGAAAGTAVIRASSEGVSADASITVTSAPLLAFSPNEVSFTGVQSGSTPGDRTVAITNVGTGSLTGLSAAVTYGAGQPTGWLSASLSGTTAPASLILSASQTGLGPGTYTATVAVASPLAANSPATVAVTLIVTAEAQPAIGLAPTTVTFAAMAGGANPAPQAVAVTNAGSGGTLSGLSVAVTYGLGQPAGWLGAVLSGTTAPTALTLTAVTGSLAPGSYSATVAVNSPVAANSPQQVQVSFTVASLAPGSPTGLTANAVSTSRIDLAWTAGSGVTQWYRIERRLAEGGTFAVIDSVPGGTLSYASTGLQAGTGYAYRVQGCTAGLCSGWSDEATATTQAAPAPVLAVSPEEVSFTGVQNGSPPGDRTAEITNAGTGDVTGLSAAVTYGAGQPTGWLSAGLSATTAPASLILSANQAGLAPGTHTATVAVSSPVAANSPQHVEVSFTVTSPAPGAPTGLTATAVATSRIDLAWTAGTGTTQWYLIERRLAEGGTFAVIDSVPGGTLTYASTDLQAGTAYGYRVQGCTAGYCSDWSGEATATTLPEDPTPPDVPGSFTGVRVSPTAIHLTWTAPGGQTHYELRRRQTGTGGIWSFEVTIPGDATEYLDEGLRAGATYQYQIRACSEDGCSDYSGTVSVGS
jgi:hypothetical protein